MTPTSLGRIAAAWLLLAPVATSALAQDPAPAVSPAKVAEISTLLAAKKLEAFAMKDPRSEGTDKPRYIAVLLIPKPAQRESHQATTMETIFGGFRYIFQNKVVLGAISLDMFAVLMGGAVALLPIYAKDILHAGPQELGYLRAAPGIGAIVMALVLTRFPIRDHAGKLLFLFVGLFGAFTVLFGFSTTIWLSVLALALVGASDMVSVTIRETIMQLWTPEEVRGRVNAVNSVFIGASNELGEFRAGTVAHLIGPVPAVVLGGVGSVAIAIIWSRIFPGLRNQRSLDKKMVD